MLDDIKKILDTKEATVVRGAISSLAATLGRTVVSICAIVVDTVKKLK